MRIDYLGLQAFLAIAERGSFLKAATHLNLSQTALSHRLRKLEESMGVPLFQRTTRHVTLTPAGLDLLPRAARAIEDLTRAVTDVAGRARATGERLAFGCLPTLALRLVPAALKRLAALHPEARVRIHDNSAAEIAAKVKSGEAAFGLTIVPTSRWDLDARPLFTEPFVLVAEESHPLARQASVAWSAVADLPLVRISAETGNRILIDDALGDLRETLRWRYEVQRVPTAIGIAASGSALTIVPKSALDIAPWPGTVAIPLVEPDISRTISVVTLRGQPLSGLAAEMLALIEDESARLS
jgi:DNA-binding transcriptional LysR family regulator